MTRRRLRPDELELWQKVAETADRMHPDHSGPLPLPKPKPTRPPQPRLTQFTLGQSAHNALPGHDLAKGPSERLKARDLRMDRKTFTRMARGKLDPEARIDLHGMTLDRAHVALSRFILTAHHQGKRLVLVITGKGKTRDEDHGPVAQRRGVLRHQVPHWLDLPPLSQAVLQVVHAHLSHGGEGAYYVYLRRHRQG